MGSERDSDSGHASFRSLSRMWFWAALSVLIGAALVVPLIGRALGGAPARPESGAMQPLPSGLDTALSALFDPLRCMTSPVAEREVRELLDVRGLGDWTIKSVATDESECVGWSLARLAEEPRTVALIPVTSPQVRSALEDIREETYSQCLTRSEVIELVRSRLAGLGQGDFDVRTDGPLQVPLDREEEILGHVRAGCWVFSTNGWIDGRFTFFVSGQS
jgi:hypothetical protein